MSKELFLIVSISVQVLFFVLDLFDRHATRHQRYDGAPLKFGSFAFMILIIFVYGLIQVGGLALIPKTKILLEWIWQVLAQGLFPNPSGQTLSTRDWLILGVIGFYIAGFWDYIVHRFISHSRLLWCTHEYHHLPNQLFLAMPGLCVRPFVVVAVFPSTLGTLFTMCFGLAALGYHHLPLMPLIYSVICAQICILLVTHSSFHVKMWWMHHVFKWIAITTPQEHELHHTVDLKGNYGNFTTLWDRLFGTYLDPLLDENKGHKLGLAYDQDFLGAITFGKLKLSEKLRRRFQIGRYCNIDGEDEK